MNLSIASANTFDSGMSALGRRNGQSDPELPSPLGSGTAQGDDEATRAESASQRPAREPQETSRLSPEEQRQLSELQQRDREVKAHELAHKAVGGRYVTGGSFTYQTGPDGHRYAIGGEVTIDSSSGATPEETLRKAELIRRAALAPADPSPQDYRVASQASLTAAQARSEIRAEQQEEALQARQARKEGSDEEADTRVTEISRQGQKAIASIEAIGGAEALKTNPDPIDELV